MVHVNFTYLNTKANDCVKRGRNSTLAMGVWIPEEDFQDVVVDKVYCTPTKERPLLEDDCDRTPTTVPTNVTPTKIHFDRRGRPQCIELTRDRDSDSDDWSVSTMGESVFDDAQPGSSPKHIARHSNILYGSF